MLIYRAYAAPTTPLSSIKITINPHSCQTQIGFSSTILYETLSKYMPFPAACEWRLGNALSPALQNSRDLICREHFQCHRLSKTPGPADADKFFFRIQKFVRTRNEPRLIHIYFRTNRLPKPFVPWIQINSHRTPPLRKSFKPFYLRNIILQVTFFVKTDLLFTDMEMLPFMATWK